MGLLPQPPEAIDIAMMDEKQRVTRRNRYYCELSTNVQMYSVV